MTIKLYNYTGEEERIDKSSLLSTATSVSGDQYEGNQSILAPSIIISSATMPTYNYAYVTEYARYYFIDGVTWIGDSLWRLNLRVDPLYSHKTAITAQSGVVQYSNQGMALNYDPRLVYNRAPSVSRAATASTLKNGGVPLILMRYKWFPNTGGSNPPNYSQINNGMHYAILDTYSFAFLYGYINTNLNNADPTLAKAVSDCIVDFTVIRWIDETQFTKTNKLNFCTPEIYAALLAQHQPALDGVDITFTYGTPPSPYYIYELSNEDPQTGYFISWLIEPTYYWQRKAQRSIYIPFVGTMDIDLDLLGQGYGLSFYAGVQIRYDFAGNAYVLTPAIGPITASPDSLPTTFPDMQVRCNNQYSVGFTSVGVNTLADNQRTAQSMGMVSQVLTGVIGAVATQGASIPMTLASIGMGAGNMALAQERTDYQKACAFKMTGSSDGGSSDCVYITTPVPAGPRTYPDVVMVTRTNEPAPGYTDYWAKYGYPDGVFRSLSLMTGYVQISEIILTGMSTVTREERDQITAALKSGVIM